MKKLSLFAVIAAMLVLASGCCKCGKDEAKVKPITYDMVIIESSAAPGTGVEDPGLTQGLQQFIKAKLPTATANVQKMDISAAKNKPEFAGMDMSYMPLYLIKKTDDMMTVFGDHIKSGFIKTVGDYIVFARQTRQGLFVDKTPQKNLLELFVMSNCPFGTMAEGRIIDAKNAGKFPKDVNLVVRYIVNDMGGGKFQSLHGQGEVDEDLRQIIIQNKFPSKFWAYLAARNKDLQGNWETAAKKAGIDPAQVKAAASTGVTLLQKDAVTTQQYGIGGSPTLVWQGVAVMDFGALGKIPGFEFFAQPAGPGGAPAVPAGGCGA